MHQIPSIGLRSLSSKRQWGFNQMAKSVRRSYKKFYDSLDSIAPKQEFNYPIFNVKIKRRLFFGQQFKSKKAIVEFVKTFPQLEDGSENYADLFKDYSERKANLWDMALVMWIGAIKHNDYEVADTIRQYAAGQGVKLSRFKGNVFMRSV